jgi:hypothetical protein
MAIMLWIGGAVGFIAQMPQLGIAICSKRKRTGVPTRKNPMNTMPTMSFGYQKKPAGHISTIRQSSPP